MDYSEYKNSLFKKSNTNFNISKFMNNKIFPKSKFNITDVYTYDETKVMINIIYYCYSIELSLIIYYIIISLINFFLIKRVLKVIFIYLIQKILLK